MLSDWQPNGVLAEQKMTTVFSSTFQNKTARYEFKPVKAQRVSYQISRLKESLKILLFRLFVPEITTKAWIGLPTLSWTWGVASMKEMVSAATIKRVSLVGLSLYS